MSIPFHWLALLGRRLLAAALVLSVALNSSARSFAADQPSESQLLRLSALAVSAPRDHRVLLGQLAREADRKYLAKLLGEASGVEFKLTYIQGRTVFIENGEERIPLKVVSLKDGIFEVFKKTFVFNSAESAEASIKRMSRALNVSESERAKLPHWSNLVMPNAEAIVGLASKLARPLATKKFAWLYLSMTALISGWCSQNNYNTVGTCVGLGAAWPLVAGVVGAGLMALGFKKLNLSTEAAAFELEDLKCPNHGGAEVKAAILGANKTKLDFDARYNANGSPQSISFRAASGEERKIVFGADGSPDAGQSSEGNVVFDEQSLQLVMKGARALQAACFKDDGRSALSQPSRTRGEPLVAPSIEPSGVSAKAVR